MGRAMRPEADEPHAAAAHAHRARPAHGGSARLGRRDGLPRPVGRRATPLSGDITPGFSSEAERKGPNNLAGLDQATGRHADAEPLHLKATQTDRTALGEGYPDYPHSLNSLVMLYRAMGRHDEAKPLAR